MNVYLFICVPPQWRQVGNVIFRDDKYSVEYIHSYFLCLYLVCDLNIHLKICVTGTFEIFDNKKDFYLQSKLLFELLHRQIQLQTIEAAPKLYC